MPLAELWDVLSADAFAALLLCIAGCKEDKAWVERVHQTRGVPAADRYQQEACGKDPAAVH